MLYRAFIFGYTHLEQEVAYKREPFDSAQLIGGYYRDSVPLKSDWFPDNPRGESAVNLINRLLKGKVSLPTIATLFERSPSRGVFVRRPLVHWEELLEEWCLVHERYCRLVHDDAIYWNGERPNIAALAAAAWRCGWAALEEFAQPKRVKRSKFAGRADLYLLSPGSEDYVEAKCDWLHVSNTKGNTVRFLHAFRAALADAGNIHLEPGKHKRVGVAFGSLYTPEDGLAPVSRGLTSVFGKLTNEDFDAAAWCFPMAAQVLKWKDRSAINHYPGVVLLAKTAV